MAKVSLRAYNREIETMVDRNHLDEAVAHCQHILKTFPKHLETYRLLGKAYLEAKRYNEAVDIFSRVLAAEPNDFVAHVGMSIIRDEQNKLDDAIWHMERAFDVQSANPAIQGELQRLYGRRDGVQPPRIRMTRGALAHMYMRGELYPQAISETKNVLEEDRDRSDMQVLRARAFYKSGQKNDAADAASTVLKRFPYCLDANLVLAQILGIDRPESAQVYRQRVIELDPYAGQAADDMFRAAEVSDAAVSIEHLEWNGQPVGMSADWGSTRAIGLESGIRDEQPSWMKASFADEPSLSAPEPGSGLEASSAPALPADDIPDFLKAAGWGASSGAFDESKSSAMFEDLPSSEAEPLAQGDLPDWVKAMAPQETAQPEAEEMPDWINKIGTGDLPIPSAADTADQPDWLGGLGEPAAQPASEAQPDWMKDLTREEQPASSESETDGLDWLSGLEPEEAQPVSSAPSQSERIMDVVEEPAPATSADDLDWLKGLEQAEEPAAPTADQPDWMKDLGAGEQPAPVTDAQPDWMKGFEQAEEQPAPAADQPDWLKNFDAQEQPAPAGETGPDWLKDLSAEPPQAEPAGDLGLLDELKEEPPQAAPVVDAGLGVTEKEQDDSFAWLEALAAKQGATEGLLTKPEERLEEEPDWIKQAKGLRQPVEEMPAQAVQPPVEAPSAPMPEASVKVEDLGRSEAERDDSFAWLEALAAKQGATEGLLTKPEERLTTEPDWVAQVKKTTGELTPAPEPQAEIPAQPEPLAEPPVDIADLGRSEAERDDSFAWLEALAAKQGATEGLLTKPEERLEAEPDWVAKVKKTTGELQSAPKQEAPAEEPPAEAVIPLPEPAAPPPAPSADLGKSEAERDDSFSWLESLAARQGATEGLLTKPEERLDAEPDWVKQARESQETGIAPSMGMPEEMPAPAEEPAAAPDVTAWLKGLDEAEPAGEPQAVAEDDTTAWLKSLDEPQEEPITFASSADDLPAWLQSVSGEETPASEPVVPMEEAAPVAESPVREAEDVPAWLRGIEQEADAPAIPAADDLPAWMRDETGEVVAEPTKIEPTRASDWTPLDETRPEAVEAVQAAPEPAPEPAPKPKKPAPKKEEVKPATPSEPYREPVTRRMTGMLTMPVDPILASARAELSRSNIPGALEAFGKLIKKGRYLEEVIFDLREALYRYPVEVSIWQSLGDAYMRANQLQEALDAYTKAEELLR